MSEVVTCTVTDGVAHIELNRPDMANTLNMALGTGLRAAAEQVAADESVRAVVISGAGQRFCGGRGEKPGVGKGKFVDLSLDRVDHRPVAVTQTGHCCAARAVEIPLPVCVDQVAAVALYGDGRALPGMARKDV